MRIWLSVLIACHVAGCSFDPSGPGSSTGDAQPGTDAPLFDAPLFDAPPFDAPPFDALLVDAPLFDAQPLGPWGNVQLIPALSDIAVDDDPTITGDLLEMYFNSNRSGGVGGGDIWVTQRASAADPWQAPSVDTVLSTSGGETTPELSTDGLTIFISRGGDIYVSMRADRQSTWSTPALVDELNSGSNDAASAPNGDLTQIALTSNRATGTDHDIYVSTRATPASMWSTPTAVAELNSAGNDYSPFFDPSALVLYFDANPTLADHDLFVATRPALDQPFAAPTRIDELSTIEQESDPWVSPDGRYMVFERTVAGNAEIFEASR